jgi:hypothetical protein
LGAAVAAVVNVQSATPSATVRSRFMICSPTLRLTSGMPGRACNHAQEPAAVSGAASDDVTFVSSPVSHFGPVALRAELAQSFCTPWDVQTRIALGQAFV